MEGAPGTRGGRFNALASEVTFRFLRQLLRWFCHPWFRLRHEGAEQIRGDGPLILAPVHRSHLDPPLVGSLTHRRVRYLGKQELFKPAPLGWLMRAVGTFPVKRGDADIEAMRAALGLLAEGNAMLVFPEGSRQETQDVAELFDGTAWLAAKSGAPVVPIGIAGTAEALPSGAKFPKRSRVAIVVGPPIDPPAGADGGRAKRSDLKAWTEALREAMQQQQARALQLAAEPR